MHLLGADHDIVRHRAGHQLAQILHSVSPCMAGQYYYYSRLTTHALQLQQQWDSLTIRAQVGVTLIQLLRLPFRFKFIRFLVTFIREVDEEADITFTLGDMKRTIPYLSLAFLNMAAITWSGHSFVAWIIGVSLAGTAWV